MPLQRGHDGHIKSDRYMERYMLGDELDRRMTGEKEKRRMVLYHIAPAPGSGFLV